MAGGGVRANLAGFLPRIDLKKGLGQDCDRWEMFLAPTPAGGEDAASTAGQEASVTSTMRSWSLNLRKGMPVKRAKSSEEWSI
jgi:hypothetical protein